MLGALSPYRMQVFAAHDAPGDAGPFICTACLTPVTLRVSGNKRTHFMHGRNSDYCRMRRDAGSSKEYRARVALEVNAYAPEGAN
ncbi:hypothetical protein SAMN05428944_3893 [Streptomyces sp. 1222.5]|uniref:DUF7830 domain-containing protein n=1 Tax=unclassified Streptomyces TaxID=2593676 RepID=UPI0008960A12|nr:MULTISPECIES: hypothetical protein [unclassified Streptomyces]PKW08963.1 hypothetical protein BX260_4201 [Streptomyces sp. 5112.2]SEC48357.1 hypothetical protein SAMN05428944_3893 [Streptomyces sp. 1222.5]SED40609.1 hypothetical protein SAMN05216532_4454 [Streptomyces sp. 2231.1]